MTDYQEYHTYRGVCTISKGETIDRIFDIKIGTKITKIFKKKVYRGLVTKYIEDEKLNFISIDYTGDDDSEVKNYRQVNRYKCADQNKDTVQ